MFEINSGVKKEAIKIVLYGPEGIGKTSIAAKFPDPLFIDTEGSTKHYDVKRLKNGQPPSSQQELINMIRWVKETKPCSTLVIDTADWAARIAGKAVLDEHNKKGIEDFGFGNGYVYQLEKYGNMLDQLTSVQEAGINVVLTAHAEIKKFEDPGEMGAYDRWELKLLKRGNANIAGMTKEWADMVLFLNYKTIAVKASDMGNKFKGQGGQRVMYTTHRPAWDAKNRFGLADEVSLDYSAIAHIIPNMVTPVPKTEPVEKQSEAPKEETNKEPEMTPAQKEVYEDMGKETPAAPDYLPKALQDLMTTNGITEDELKGVAGLRGHFPINTDFETISKTSPEYFTGGLVANWDSVVGVVNNIRNNRKSIVDLWTKVVGNEEEAASKTAAMNIQFNQ